MLKRFTNNNRLVLFIPTLFFVVCVLRFPCDQLRLSFSLLFEWGTAILLAVFIWKYNRYWALFLLMALFSAIYPLYSRWSYLGLQAIVCASVWFLLLSMAFTRESVKNLFTAICLIALMNVAMLLLQAFNMDPLYLPIHGTKAPMVGLMANQNEVSALLAICFPAFIRPRWWILTPLLILGIFLSHSMGGLFAVGVGMIFYQVMKGKVLLPLAVVIIAFLVYALLIDPPGWERWTMWQHGSEVGRKRWLLGGGLGHWKIVMAKVLAPHLSGTWCKTAHSDIFQLWFEMGIAPILLICGYLWSIARRYRPEALIAVTAVIIILANCMVHFLFHIATTGIIAVTWIAILELQLGKNRIRYKDGPAIAY